MFTYAHTIPIPAPALPGDLEQLAQIQVPENKLLVVYWMRSTRQVVCEYDDKWYIQSDQNIMNGVSRLIKYEKNIDLLKMDELFIFETPGHGRAADDDLVRNFRECEWSDYASDRIAFQCSIREKTLYEKNAMDRRIVDMSHNNRIKYDIAAAENHTLRNTPVPPVLTRSTECCCTGCHKVVNAETTGVQNRKW
jgi:hypothetical protein